MRTGSSKKGTGLLDGDHLDGLLLGLPIPGKLLISYRLFFRATLASLTLDPRAAYN